MVVGCFHSLWSGACNLLGWLDVQARKTLVGFQDLVTELGPRRFFHGVKGFIWLPRGHIYLRV